MPTAPFRRGGVELRSLLLVSLSPPLVSEIPRQLDEAYLAVVACHPTRTSTLRVTENVESEQKDDGIHADPWELRGTKGVYCVGAQLVYNIHQREKGVSGLVTS